MNSLKQIINSILAIPSVNKTYIFLITGSIIVLIILGLLKTIGLYIIKRKFNDKKLFSFSRNYRIFINIICGLVVFFIWDEYIKSIITLISLISAAFAIAIRDIIFNFFCGLYIQIKKPFQIEDRIELDGIKGDVMNITSMSFEILEINDKIENGQSTGKVVTFPNCFIFTKSLKNYTKGFKYIWNEMTIKVSLDCDLTKNKREIYKIVNGIETVTNIPKKMKNQVNIINVNSRIYFNKYEPMIYTKIVDNHIELELRYLINPKKARYVESIIWNKILVAYKNNNIQLYSEI